MTNPPARRSAAPLLLRLFAIGVATAIGIAGSWFTAHKYVPFEWPEGAALAREMPARWAAGSLQDELDRVRRSTSIEASVFDTRGALVASSVQPAFVAPTREEQGQAAEGEEKSRFGRVVAPLRRAQALIGFCVLNHSFPPPPLWGVVTDLVIISSWISVVGYLAWRTLVRPLQNNAAAAEAFGGGHMAARTGVDRSDEIGKVARAFDDMSERIARSREAERELMASVSHELRTPMARIRVALDLAAESDGDTVRASLADVAEDLTELETLIGNIFSTTRLAMAAAGRDDQPVPLERADVDVAALVEKAVAHQRAQHPQRPYALDIADSVAGRCICADAVLIRRAIENVLDNAHKYSPGASPVSITVGRETRGFRVAIADRGFGIGPDDLPRVFSPFFRADRSRTRATGGVGLGLALAKRVVEAHGGSIGIASQVEVGTTVTLVLPLAEARRRTADAPGNIS